MSKDTVSPFPDPDNIIGHTFIGYMDATDAVYEEGRPKEGNNVYDDPERVLEYHKCADECGIVKVEVKITEWARRPKQ